MKRITFLALACAMAFGLMAQNFLKPAGERTGLVSNKFINKESGLVSATIGEIICTEHESSDTTTTPKTKIGFDAQFSITKGAGTHRFYYDMYQAGMLENFVDTSSVFSSIEEYLLAYCKYNNSLYGAYGVDVFDSVDGDYGFVGLWGNTAYTIYVLSIDEDTTQVTLDSITFTTPSSAKSGTPTITVTNDNDTEVGEINFTTVTSDTRRFYFFCAENSDSVARAFTVANNLSEEEGYKRFLSYWLNSQHSSYFTFDWDGDVNENFSTNLFASDGKYVNGIEYVWGALPINGNGEQGDFVYAVFTFGNANLNDVAELMNIQVYPNPVRESLNINSKVNMNKVELYNALGQVVYSSKLNSNTVNIPVSDLNNGTYFVKAYGDGVVVNKKVIVE